MVTKDLVDGVVIAAGAAVDSARSVGNAETDKEASDASLLAAQQDNAVKLAALNAAESDLTAKKAALDASVAALTAAF